MNAMRGTILWNIGLGVAGFLITMLASSATNLWSTSIIRGLLAFVVWFVCGYGIRFVAQLLLTSGQSNTVHSDSSEDASTVGTAVNYTTPDDSESLYQMLHSSSNVPEASEKKEPPAKEEFQPLTPPRFVTKPFTDEQMAQAVRYLNEK